MKKNKLNQQLEKFVQEKGFKGFKNHKEKEEEKEDSNSWAKSYNIHEKFMEETAKIMERENPDVFKEHKPKTISDRENSYQSRWRKRKLSPERVDSFKGEGKNPEKRSYGEILLENKLEREKKELLDQIERKKKEEERRQKYEKLKEEQEKKEQEKKQKMETDIEEKTEIQLGANKWGKEDEEKPKEKPIIVEPNFKPTGKLYKGMITENGVELKWLEPRECKLPKEKWRLYIYKEGKQLGEPIKIYTKTYFLFGKDNRIVDIKIEHETCSKQHAVLCFREVENKVIPYIIDLKSTNGTKLNKKKIEDSRYYELREFDMIQFGESTREYILLHENSKLE